MLPENRCALCHGILNAATMVDGDDVPRVGDVSICFYCGNVMVFDDDLNLRTMTKAEAELIYSNETVLKAIVMIQTRGRWPPSLTSRHEPVDGAGEQQQREEDEQRKPITDGE